MKIDWLVCFALMSSACISAPPESNLEPDSDSGTADMAADLPEGQADMTSQEDMTPVNPSCDDGILNQSETDLDCGGECESCRIGLSCVTNSDCTSGLCEGNVCVVKSECIADPVVRTLDQIPESCAVIGLKPGNYSGRRYEYSVELAGLDAGVNIGRTEFVGEAAEVFRATNVRFDCELVDDCGTPDFGGGIYHIGGTLYLENVSFGPNFAIQEGGSIYSNDASEQGALYILSSTFDNASSTIGGNIYVENTGPFYMRNSLSRLGFVDDSGSKGGGIYLAQGNAEIVDSNFEENQVGRDGTPTEDSHGGGAIYFAPPNADDQLHIIDSGFTQSFLVSENEGSGAAIFVAGGKVVVRGSLFKGNIVRAKQAQGGAIAVRNGNLTLINSSFIDNELRANSNDSTLYGGAIGVQGAGEVGIQNSTFSGNGLDTNEWQGTTREGFALYISADSTVLRSVTFGDAHPNDQASVQVRGPASIENVYFGGGQPFFSDPQFLPLNLMVGTGDLENVNYTNVMARFHRPDFDYTVPAPIVEEKVICHDLEGQRLLVDQLGQPRDLCTPGAVQ